MDLSWDQDPEGKKMKETLSDQDLADIPVLRPRDRVCDRSDDICALPGTGGTVYDKHRLGVPALHGILCDPLSSGDIPGQDASRGTEPLISGIHYSSY